MLSKALLTACAGIALTIASPVWATSCIRSSAPKIVDPFSGVIDRQLLGAGNGTPIGDPSLLNVAVILSQNTKDQIDWSNKVTHIGGFDKFMGALFTSEQLVEDGERLCQLAYDPKLITDNVMQPLVHRFHDVKVISDFSQFAHSNYDLLVLLDVSFIDIFSDGPLDMGFGGKYETGTNINAYLIDRNYVLRGQVQVALKQKAHRSEYLKDVAALRANAVSEYMSEVTRLLGPDPTLTSRPPTTTVADRLKAVDELLRQGLITPDQAASKKAEILKSL